MPLPILGQGFEFGALVDGVGFEESGCVDTGDFGEGTCAVGFPLRAGGGL